MSKKPDYLALCSIAAQKARAQRAAQRRYRDRKNKELEVHE